VFLDTNIKGLHGRSQGFFPKYDGGVFDKKLIVSSGLTNTMPIPRLGNPTELVFIELKKEK
jgi:predicted MPP superfamily phosphohydrolase